MILYYNTNGSMKVPKDQVAENPVVVARPTTTPRPPSPPDESTPFGADDEDMPETEYRDPSVS
eukprot:12884910-Prorocentrum_lima.AAC.1